MWMYITDAYRMIAIIKDSETRFIMMSISNDNNDTNDDFDDNDSNNEKYMCIIFYMYIYMIYVCVCCQTILDRTSSVAPPPFSCLHRSSPIGQRWPNIKTRKV